MVTTLLFLAVLLWRLWRRTAEEYRRRECFFGLFDSGLVMMAMAQNAFANTFLIFGDRQGSRY